MRMKNFNVPLIIAFLLLLACSVNSFGENASNTRKLFTGEEALSLWSEVVASAKLVAECDLDEIQNFSPRQKHERKSVLVSSVGKVTIRPLKALLAEGGNKYVIFLGEKDEVLCIFLVNSSANSVYRDGWQIRPVKYTYEDKKINIEGVSRITFKKENCALFLSYGSKFDALMGE
jgi:hypothetical protein